LQPQLRFTHKHAHSRMHVANDLNMAITSISIRKRAVGVAAVAGFWCRVRGLVGVGVRCWDIKAPTPPGPGT
jgi:hypothetical protein